MACCFSDCANTRKKNPELTFFRFPREKERCYLWMKRCNNAAIQNLTFSELQYRVVCEEHFSSRCFDVSQLTSGKLRRSLFKFALPEPAAVVDALRKEEENNKNCRPTALAEPPCFPGSDLVQYKVSDLASPKQLMSMTENFCHMIRPISPLTPLDTQEEDGDIFMPSIPPLPPLSPAEDRSQASALVQISFSPTETSASSVQPKPPCSHSKKDTKKRKIKQACTDHIVTIGRSESRRLRKYQKILPKRKDSNKTGRALHLTEKTESVPSRNDPGDGVLNYSNMKIKNLKKAMKQSSGRLITDLILNNNLLDILPSIDSYSELTTVSLQNNRIDNLIWFTHLPKLQKLNLAQNNISNVDVLSELLQLTHIDLSSNKITSLSGYKPTLSNKLKHLNLSSNQITDITNLKPLVNLKELNLHKNVISSLKCWRNHLPTSLRALNLSGNCISSLHDVTELSALNNLQTFSIKSNPCLNDLLLVDAKQNPLGSPRSFDYRPFVFALCPSLSDIDGKPVSVDERLVYVTELYKAVWLTKEGHIHRYKADEEGRLLTYLSQVCPATAANHMEEKELEIDFNKAVQQSQMANHGRNMVLQNIVSSLESKVPVQTAIPVTLHQLLLKNKCIDIQISNSNPDSKRVTLLNSLHLPIPQVQLHDKENAQKDCTASSCKHYIELIEEKARCHKLQRSNEELSERIQLLEAILSQNGLSLDDLEIKLEEEETIS